MERHSPYAHGLPGSEWELSYSNFFLKKKLIREAYIDPDIN